MDIEVASILAGYGDLEVREDYSGRGMFGKTTTGLVGDMPKVMRAIGEVMVSRNEDDIETIGYALANGDGFRIDSMGMSIIIY